ncbi:MAG: cardiolipin synthase [Bacilli bacterium]
MKKTLTKIFSPVTLTAILFLIQFAILIVAIYLANLYLWIIQMIFEIIAIPIAIIIINSKMDNGYKISWLFFDVVTPIFGTIFYLLFANKKFKRKEKKIVTPIKNTIKAANSAYNTLEKIDLEKDDNCCSIAKYITDNSCSNLYSNTNVTFYKWGEDAFPHILEKLKTAKKYIFLEYFIIHPGKMWNSILDILIQKAKEGVDVRVIYDDFGCLSTLPRNYYKKLNSYGIKSFPFNKIKPIIDIRYNNRDHRKIIVIDGYIGFTGGINLADEYINEEIRFGKWKDNAIMIVGEAVFSLTTLFLSTWHIFKEKEKLPDFEYYQPRNFLPKNYPLKRDGLVQPYGSVPYDYESIGHNVYLKIINRANKYIYISTPYLILNQEMQEALCLEAKSGVDVRILCPGIPDKKLVFEVTRSYYRPLIEAGVKIYEYEPGFVHGKVFLADDIMGTVGTVNLDYRSLFLHFENSTFIYKSSCLKDIYNDFTESFVLSKKISLESCVKTNIFRKLFRIILRIFAPLL